MELRHFFETWFNRAWVQEDLSAFEEMLQPDLTVRGLTDEPQLSRQGFQAFAEAFYAQCNITDVEIKHFMQDGHWAQMLVTFKGLGRTSGTPVQFTAQTLARVENNKIVEAYNHVDFIGAFQQLGTLPADILARNLTGTVTA